MPCALPSFMKSMGNKQCPFLVFTEVICCKDEINLASQCRYQIGGLKKHRSLLCQQPQINQCVSQHKLHKSPGQVLSSKDMMLSMGREVVCSVLHCSCCIPWQTRGPLGLCWGSDLGQVTAADPCLLFSVLGGLTCRALALAPWRALLHQATMAPAPRPSCPGYGALCAGWCPGKLRSYQRGLFSTKGDSLSYSPESGSMKEAGNDYGAYGGA